MSEVKNGNGKAIWITIGSVAVFVAVMVGLFSFSINPLTEKVNSLEKYVVKLEAEKDALEKIADSNESRITKVEGEVRHFEKDTDEDNKKITDRLEKLEEQQRIGNRFLDLLSKK